MHFLLLLLLLLLLPQNSTQHVSGALWVLPPSPSTSSSCSCSCTFPGGAPPHVRGARIRVVCLGACLHDFIAGSTLREPPLPCCCLFTQNFFYISLRCSLLTGHACINFQAQHGPARPSLPPVAQNWNKWRAHTRTGTHLLPYLPNERN